MRRFIEVIIILMCALLVGHILPSNGLGQNVTLHSPHHDLQDPVAITTDGVHLYFGGLNRETREVKRGEKQISLTAKEFALLEHLMSHVNKPISRTAILDHVWGYDYDTLTNVVDVYIGYLRKKIDHGFSEALIHTVRDIGYKIAE